MLPASALAQASRTWVSADSTASDANPCSRTAPCSTFSGAITKTAAGGEINALTPGGYGGVTITKSITIDATGAEAGVLVDGTNGIVVNAGDSDTVTLKGLDFEGLGTGLAGVRILHAGNVRLADDEIGGFQQGVDFQPTAPITPATAPTPTLHVDDSQIHDNSQEGVRVAPNGGTAANAYITNSTIENNGCGIVGGSNGLDGGAFTTTGCGVLTGGSPNSKVNITSSGTSITGNTGDGVLSAGANATNYLMNDTISGNGHGLSELSGGRIVAVGNNGIFGNTTDGSPSSTEAAGSVGPAGKNGADGKNGANGKVELVTCKTVTVTKKKKVGKKTKKVKVKEQKCTGKLVSGTVKFTITGKTVHATLSRSKRVVASGTIVSGRARTEGLFVVSRRVGTGWYTLTTMRNRRVLSRRSVRVT
jgi:hypothetical protein